MLSRSSQCITNTKSSITRQFIRHSSSNKSKKLNKARTDIPTRFPTQFNPIRSASNPRIQLPKGLSYNPAPSAPTPYQTPEAFLPKNDKRKIRYEAQPYPTEDMPPLRQPAQKNYNLTPEQIEEIQQLRLQDPVEWNRKNLAKKFNCSEFVISLVSNPPKGHIEEMDRRLSAIKSLWTETRTRTRYERERRKKMALRDAF